MQGAGSINKVNNLELYHWLIASHVSIECGDGSLRT